MARLLIVAFLLGGALTTPSGAEGVTPVQKVISLLQDMVVKAQDDKKAEEVEYAKFAQFCKGEIASKTKEIAETKALIEVLAADIAMLESDAKKLGEEIAALEADVSKYTAQLKAAKEERTKDAAGYHKEIEDCGSAVDAIDRALAVLTKQDYDRKQAAAALTQLAQSPRLTEKARVTMEAFIELSSASGEAQPNVDAQDKDIPDEQLFYAAPEANAYENQSGGIISMLKELGKELLAQKTEAEKANLNSEHAFNLMSQDLYDAIENAKGDIDSKTRDKAEKIAEAATKSKELAAAQADLAEDEKYLKDLTAECTEKSKSFEEKQELRANEIETLSKAIEIIGSADVSGAADTHLPALVQRSGAALVQLRSGGADAQTNAGIRLRLAAFLLSKSQSLGSKRLGLLAQQIGSSADPFKKVKKMIWDMIQKLMEEANAESELKGFCDTELGTSKITRNKLSAEIADLTAAVDEMTASIAQMTAELAGLAKDVNELTVAMEKATAIRETEKAKNQATIADAVTAQKAVEAATALIKDFYAKAGTATALVQNQLTSQAGAGAEAPVKMGTEEWKALANPNYDVDQGHRAGMQTFGATFKGNQGGAGSVLAFLEVILGNFASLEADTSADESQAQELYDEFMAESKKTIAVKQKNIEMITSDMTEEKASLLSSKKDLASNQDQLLAANRYYDELKPKCEGTGISYEERAKRRQEEIVSLQEALKILSGEGI